MNRKYKSIFSNTHISENSGIIDFDSTDYTSLITVNGIIIEVDGFEDLLIDNIEQYTEEQLNQFDYNVIFQNKEKTKKLLVLRNYKLKTFVPVSIINKKTNEIGNANLIIELEHNGKELTIICSLLEEESEKVLYYDIEIAINNIQKKSNYFIKICACCKYSFWNPYGGSAFINHLCFRKDFEKFQSIKEKGKFTVGAIMKYDEDRNFDFVYLIDSCKYYKPRE
jgi:hypothetical protein